MEVKFLWSWRIWIFGITWGPSMPGLRVNYFAINLGPFCCMFEWPDA